MITIKEIIAYQICGSHEEDSKSDSKSRERHTTSGNYHSYMQHAQHKCSSFKYIDIKVVQTILAVLTIQTVLHQIQHHHNNKTYLF